MDHQRIFDKELEELKDSVLKMGVMVQGLIHKAVEAVKKQDQKMAEEVIKEDEKVDQLELEIDEKCIELIALRQPEASDLRFLTTAMRMVTDLERIGDLAEDISERVMDLVDTPLVKQLVDLPQMAKLAQESISIVLDSFINRDSQKVKKVWENEKETNRLRDAIREELSEIMTKDPSTVPSAIPLLLVSRHLERISDHITNIAEDIVYMVEAKVIRHGGFKEEKKIEF
jgi:phosphate transport system protein